MVHVNSAEKSYPTNTFPITEQVGMSIIEHEPVFSDDAEYLLILTNKNIDVYATATADLFGTYDTGLSSVVALTKSFKYPDVFVGCSKFGSVKFWKWQSGLQTIHSLELNLHSRMSNIYNFALIHSNSKNQAEILATFSQKNQVLNIGIFNKDGIPKFVPTNLKVGGSKLSVGRSEIYAIIQERKLQIGKVNQLYKSVNITARKSRKWTCVAVHPTDEIVAVGDQSGRIVLYTDVFSKSNSVMTVYHWHTLPVLSLAFSQNGTHMYSGGEELVLVKWVLDSPLHRSFLPRLSGAIKHIVVSPDNLQIALATQDNAIQIIDNQHKFRSIIQHMSWMTDGSDVSANLLYDPRSQAIVAKSRIGQIQFFCPYTKSILYKLDITGHNQLTSDQQTKVININVQNIAISDKGTWMATVEERNDPENNFESRFKFWKFDDVTQMWCLNTVVTIPHEGGVTGLCFRPSRYQIADSNGVSCFTIGNDLRFKIWSLMDNSDIYKKKQSWRSVASGYFCEEKPTCINCSYDGSLVGIGFGASLTIWLPDTCELKCDLVYKPFSDENLTNVIFGNVTQCQLVITSSKNRICVWNLLSLSLLWTVALKVDVMCRDPKSEHIAVFTRNNQLFIFTPQNAQPVYSHDDVTPKGVLSATFVPNKIPSRRENCLQKSQLYFLDSTQVLFAIEGPKLVEDDSSHVLEVINRERQLVNPFNALKISQNNYNRNNRIINNSRSLLPGSVTIKELIKMPCHSCAPMRFMCDSILKSLLHVNYDKLAANIDSVNEPPSLKSLFKKKKTLPAEPMSDSDE